MGSYLSQPVTEKETEEGELYDYLIFGACAMQGWRRSMEDEHIAIALNPPQNNQNLKVSMFGVWDGHGGKEVARYVRRYMHLELMKLDEYQNGDIEKALIRVFHRIDEMLWDQANHQEVLALKTDEKPSNALPSSNNSTTNDNSTGGNVPSLAASSSSSSSSRLAAATPFKEDDEDDDGEGINTNELLDIFKTLMASRGNQPKNQEGATSDSEAASSNTQTPPPLTRNSCNLPAVPITAGCTSVVALLLDRLLYVANAGDSRGVLCRQGKAVALSEDHKPSQEREIQRISKAGGFITEAGRINGNLNLSRSIGDLKYKQSKELPVAEQMITAEPDVTVFNIDPATDEFMILACDGIWDCFTNEVAVDFVRSRLAMGMTPVEVSKAACDECLAEDPKASQGIGGDNMTCLVVVFKAQGVSC